ncbi:IS701 family transposase, partial [Streptomyces sp. NPDC051917]|uniref:IS701 family transposase n=1 Tax=Streptomyces sp. NPDC051917 TaxID=3154754 RepID=UPI00345528C8
MDAHEVNRVRATLALFVADVFASVPRKDQRAKGDCYLRGLMLDGRRKSIQAMASRLPDGNEQNLQQFVNQSTWDPVPVQRRICERMLPLITPTAWVIDDVSVPKDGRMSVAVAPQYCGALGKRANCQVAVSVHAATDTASCPLQWRLFLPKEWASDTDRRTATRIPPEIIHREKWRLALDMLDTLAGWGMTPPVVVADAAYGTNAHLRACLAERGIDYVLAVRADVTAHPFDAEPRRRTVMGPSGAGRSLATATEHRRWRPWPPASDRRPSPPLPGGRAHKESYGPASPPCGSAPRARPSSVRSGPPPRPSKAGGTVSCPTAGCWSSGPKTPKLPPITGSPTCRPTRRSPTWSVWPRSAGASRCVNHSALINGTWLFDLLFGPGSVVRCRSS